MRRSVEVAEVSAKASIELGVEGQSEAERGEYERVVDERQEREERVGAAAVQLRQQQRAHEAERVAAHVQQRLVEEHALELVAHLTYALRARLGDQIRILHPIIHTHTTNRQTSVHFSFL